jgi:glyoxylase-like metal-dependent hydrolase (beta-lactamase superfamily II)
MTRRGMLKGTLKGALAAAVLVNNSAAGLFLSTYGAAPLGPPQLYPGGLPPASPPSQMAAFQIPTGVSHCAASFGYRGGAFSDRRDFVMTAVLVKHPRGDLLIDTGLGRQIDRQFQLMPAAFRAITKYDRISAAADLLDAAGYDFRSLSGILLTHAHWDHVSGVADFPGIPVLLSPTEREFIDTGGPASVIARNISGADYQPYDFEGGPYLGFPCSHDVYGDGSLVSVPAPGHTPGSVIVFMTLPDSRRFAFVGDLVWQREGITEREERPWFSQRLVNEDSALVRDNLLRMSAVAEQFPEIILAPAHDARGFAELPLLSGYPRADFAHAA